MKQSYQFMGNGYQFVRIVKRLLGNDFIKEEFADGVEFIHFASGKRLLKLMDRDDRLMVRFDYPVPNLSKCTLEVRHDDHMHWDYEGEHLEDIIAMIEIALENFRRKEAGDRS